MLAIDLVKALLLVFVISTIVFGISFSFDKKTFGDTNNTLLLLAAIALIIVFHI